MLLRIVADELEKDVIEKSFLEACALEAREMLASFCALEAREDGSQR